MDDLMRANVLGTLTAQRLLIEHLYRLLALYDPQPGAFFTSIGALQMSMLDDDRAINAGALPPALEFEIRQHALHYLEEFWGRMDRSPAGAPRRGERIGTERPARYAWRKHVPLRKSRGSLLPERR